MTESTATEVVLHRLPLSGRCEAARLALVHKSIPHRLVDHAPGAGHAAVLQRSGQRAFPVLEHAGSVVPGATAIGLYLEHAFPHTRPLLPTDFKARRAVLDLDERLHDVLGTLAPRVAFDEALRDGALWGDTAVAALGGARVLRPMARVVGVVARAASFVPAVRDELESARVAVRRELLDLCRRLEDHGCVLGPEPTLADVAAAGLTLPVCLPDDASNPLRARAGEGVRELLNDPAIGRFFAWRARTFYR